MAITAMQLGRAFSMGEKRAQEEIEEGVFEPNDDVLEDEEFRRDLVFSVTGEKLDPDSEEGWLIADNYERGYYDWYYDLEQEKAA